ncbi:MAG: HAMP domain-containing protein, partial [Chloroflexi bacterium]|nr:HAMP domain-containing protein [Chloroflexota bacterium]
LTHAPWGVGVGQYQSETFAATLDLRDRALIVAAMAMAIALGCAWVGTQSVVGPILALTRAGDRMATGDLSDPIHVTQPDEVGRLGHVLETMRQRLGQSLDEIMGLNRDLEQRVRARTNELEITIQYLRALVSIATAASRGDPPQAVLRRALQELAEALKARSAWAFLWDESQQQLRLAAGYRLREPAPEGTTVADSDAACLLALRSGTLVSRRQACCPEDGCPALGADRGAPDVDVRCWCAPIRIGEWQVGSFCLALENGRVPEGEEEALVHGVAQQVGFAFETARLTEEQARFEATRRLELLRAELLGSVSHELRTPLSFIKGYTSTLLRDDVTWEPEQKREALTIMDEECDRLAEIIDSLLDAARVQAGRLELKCEPTEIERVIRRTTERLAGSLNEHTVELHIEASPTIIADATRLEQVVFNLLQNAAKYSPTGGPIDVRVQAEAEGVRIGILDRGVSVPPAEATKIFEPFYRVSNGHAAKIGGVGLGLAVCRAIVEAHGGRIWAEPRPGGGTGVYLTLPWRAHSAGGSADESEVRARH